MEKSYNELSFRKNYHDNRQQDIEYRNGVGR